MNDYAKLLFKKAKEKNLPQEPLKNPLIQESQKELEKMVPNEDDFIPKQREEVIKVSDCDNIKDGKYYLCNCLGNDQDFQPICEECAFNCHKTHNPTLEVPGINVCSCGLTNHVITPEMNNIARQKEYTANEAPQCFYSKFFNITPNRGFFLYEEVVYCSVCVEFCIKKNFDDPTLIKCNNKTICRCRKFHEINVVKMNADFISRKKFHLHMRNFNFNILFKIPESKLKYIEALIMQLDLYEKKAITNAGFFNNFINFKILELFSAFAACWENKFFYVVNNLLRDFRIELLLELMSINYLNETIDNNFAQQIAVGKFYFAELLFNHVMRSFLLKCTNLWNVRTIFNMTLYQRFLYLKNIRTFYLFRENEFIENKIDKVIEGILELYDNIMKINERYNIIEKIISYVFPTFNRIMKYLIKYCLIKDDLKDKYFKLVLDSIQLNNEGEKGSLKNSSFYLMKSILYELVYLNDQSCIDYLRKNKRERKKFVFQKREDTERLSLIFSFIIRDYDREEDPSRTMIFDYYVKQFLDLMMEKEDFYINTIRNLDIWEINTIIYFDENVFYTKVRNELPEKDYKSLWEFIDSMNHYNRQYFEYGITQEDYSRRATEILSKFRDFTLSRGVNLDEIRNPYFFCKINPKSIEPLKKCILHSTFFQKIEEFIHIYAQGKLYPAESLIFDYTTNEQLDNLGFLLKLLYALCYKDLKFLCLVMNIKPKIFVLTFYDVPDLLVDFIERITEMVYLEYIEDNIKEEDDDSSYKFDNLYFISECITELLIINEDNIPILTELMRISIKSIQSISINNLDFLNAVEQFNATFKKLKEKKSLVSRMKKFFKLDYKPKQPLILITEEEDDDKEENVKEVNEIAKFIEVYYTFLSEMRKNDIFFFNYMKDADILSKEDLIMIFSKFIHKEYNFPIETEYGFVSYFLIISHPFPINIMTIDNEIINMSTSNLINEDKSKEISKDVQFPLLDLAKADQNENKTRDVLYLSNILVEYFKSFSIDKFNEVDIIFLMKYYENLIFLPMYEIFNLIILQLDKISGKDVYPLYLLVFYFLNITIIVYTKNNERGNLKEEEKMQFAYENIYFNANINQQLNQIAQNADQLNKEIHYFELRKIFLLYQNSIKIIINSHSPYIKISNQNQGEFIDVNNESKLLNSLQLKKKLIDKYKHCKDKTYDENLSFIHALKQVNAEMERDCAFDIAKYFRVKLLDTITDQNIRFPYYNNDNENEKDNDNDNESVNFEFKVQNLYILKYINNVFYHDLIQFQEAFQRDKAKISEEFWIFIAKKFIVASTLNEVIKLYSFNKNKSKLSIYNGSESISFQIGKQSIKFFQNLCDGHNREYQNEFSTILKFEIYFKDDRQNQNSISHEAMIESEEESNSSESKSEISNITRSIRDVHFFNIISIMMAIINENLHCNKNVKSNLLSLPFEFQNLDNILELYQRYIDLMVEIIQGLEPRRIEKLHNSSFNDYHNIFNRVKKDKKGNFGLLNLASQIKNYLYQSDEIFNPRALKMKYGLFVILNNIISQDYLKENIIKNYLLIFSNQSLIDIISKILRGIYLIYIKKANSFYDSSFNILFNKTNLTTSALNELESAFKTDLRIYKDNFFKLASQMFLFISILGKKYSIYEANKILKYEDNEIKEISEDTEENSCWIFSLLKNKVAQKDSNSDSLRNAYIKDYIISSKFFNSIIQQCKFKIDFQDKGLTLKTIYFIIDPHAYYVSKTYIDNFIDNVDRSSSKTKLQSLMDILDLFMAEVEYKSEIWKQTDENNNNIEISEISSYIRYFLSIDYIKIYYINFAISLMINLILLFFLDEEEKNEKALNTFTSILVGAQFIMNIVFLVIFLLSKYKFYVFLSLKELGIKKKLTLYENIQVYLLNSFFLNEEIYLLIVIIILGGIGILSHYNSFFFILQLLSAIKFVDSIKEIFIAFKIQFTEFICMIGFLAVLIFFFANVGFYFYIDEFDTIINDNKENYCRTLLECSILYFYHGTITGGGIGDVLGEKSFEDMSEYLLRWFTDLVFFIIIVFLLLNMATGIIVSVFLKIREKSNEKDEDMNNICFICNIDRIEFEKKKVDFQEHQIYEHNLLHYIQFLIYLKRIPEKDLDYDQSFIIKCLKERDIKFFPVKCAESLGGDLEDRIEEDGEEESEEEEDI